MDYNNESVPTLSSGKLDSCNVYTNYTHVSEESVPCPDGWTYSPYITEIPGAPDEHTVVMEVNVVMF